MQSRSSTPSNWLRSYYFVRAIFSIAWIAAVILLLSIAVVEAASASRAEMPTLVLGNTWKWCGLRIVTLSLPMSLALMAGLRRLAPTRLTLAGAAAGLAAGGLAAVIYGFYCQETSAIFVVIWYSLGVAASAALGALIGPRLLRW